MNLEKIQSVPKCTNFKYLWCKYCKAVDFDSEFVYYSDYHKEAILLSCKNTILCGLIKEAIDTYNEEKKNAEERNG